MYPLKPWRRVEMLDSLPNLVQGMTGILFDLVFVLLPSSLALSEPSVRWRARVGWLAPVLALFYVGVIVLFFRHTVRVEVWLASEEGVAKAKVDRWGAEPMKNLDSMEYRDFAEANIRHLGTPDEELRNMDIAMMKVEIANLA